MVKLSISFNSMDSLDKAQLESSLYMPSMCDSDNYDSDEDDDNVDEIPNPQHNLKRSLAWSQDDQDGDNTSTMDIDEMPIISVSSSRSNHIDSTSLLPHHNEEADKENGVRPVLWGHHISSELNLEAIYQGRTDRRY